MEHVRSHHIHAAFIRHVARSMFGNKKTAFMRVDRDMVFYILVNMPGYACSGLKATNAVAAAGPWKTRMDNPEYVAQVGTGNFRVQDTEVCFPGPAAIHIMACEGAYTIPE